MRIWLTPHEVCESSRMRREKVRTGSVLKRLGFTCCAAIAAASCLAASTLVTGMALSPDGSTVAVAVEFRDPYHSYSVYLYSLTDGILLSTVRGGARRTSVSSVAFSPDGKTLAIGQSSSDIRRINLSTGSNFPPLDLPGVGESRGADVTAVAFTRDGKYLASCDQWGFRVWNVESNKLVFDQVVEKERRSGSLYDLAISPDGEILAARDQDSYFEYDWRKNTQSSRPGAPSFSFRPDGKAIAFLAAKITIRSALTKRVIRSAPAEIGKYSFNALAYSSDGKLLALGGVKALGLYQPTTGAMHILYNGHGVFPFLNFTPDNKQIVFGIQISVADNENQIGVWDLTAHKMVRTIPLPPPPEN